MILTLRRIGRALFPTSECLDEFERLKMAVDLKCEVTRPRNIKFHRLFFALVKKVWDSVDHDEYPSIKDMRAAITIEAGHRFRVHLPGGQIGFAAKSIAFSAMKDDEFRVFFDAVCDRVCKVYLHGTMPDALRREIELMVGIPIDDRLPQTPSPYTQQVAP